LACEIAYGHYIIEVVDTLCSLTIASIIISSASN
jgi:hypothetical protein